MALEKDGNKKTSTLIPDFYFIFTFNVYHVFI